MEIPEVGTLEIRNNIAAVSFLESLKFQIKVYSSFTCFIIFLVVGKL